MMLRFLLLQPEQIMVVYLAYLRLFQEHLTVRVLSGDFGNYVCVDEHDCEAPVIAKLGW